MRLFALSVVSALLSSSALAQEEAPPPPPSAEEYQEEELALEPQVRIIRREGAIVQEYRIQGQLYMVRIVPDKGVPYYLIDTDGDGSLETHRHDLADPVAPQWPILRW